MNYDCIIIGAGHAGIEASLASARMGLKTALVTLCIESIGRMSCNPAIGGIGKGQIVKEIDALGGEMARATDQTAIQFRMLNLSKGPAVWSPRAQCDKTRYSEYMRNVLLRQINLEVIEDEACEIIVENGKVTGVRLKSGKVFQCKALILTTGTFLSGLMHCGELKIKGGRIDEGASYELSESLRKLGFELGRLKTGTPPRIYKGSIDFTKTTTQKGDDQPKPFSFFTVGSKQKQIVCWITYTNPDTHRIILENLHRAPMYSGQIKSRGPRYCPSIEDKVVRFKDKQSHQVFMEPEGLETDSVYLNGVSTSTPPDVQESFIRTIPALENAKFLRYGYAVEYDFSYPHQLKLTLETKSIDGLFFAGQINGTSGYEEAAGQGIIAGINVALKVKGQRPFILKRSEAYIGVMIDDLTAKSEVTEPYRMFTSLAEYRLILRTDNAERRLMRYGHKFGLIPDSAVRKLDDIEQNIEDTKKYLAKHYHGCDSLEKLLKRPETTIDNLMAIHPKLSEVIKYEKTKEQVQIEIKYDGYIQRQMNEKQKFEKLEERYIPANIDYTKVKHLRAEAREKLTRYRPFSIGQASRISGISPADLQILITYIS